LKYIFVAGAPGSKWSSVVKNIYYSPNIDQSDYTDVRTYYHDATGKMELMHLGAYFDPGMEFGDWFDRLDQHSKQECEAEFDRPFNGDGVRIIKSHVFMYHVEFLKKTWPDCPIILVHRGDDACLGWWVRCGHFDITYPDYHKYYRNLRHMAAEIRQQNSAMRPHWDLGSFVYTNHDLCQHIGIDLPPELYRQNYAENKVRVKVIRN
jgi:hypothetical protein